jgi:sulfate adenylyltransferase subunit 2
MSRNIVWHKHEITKNRRVERYRQKPCVLWFTGLSGSGKSTIANKVEEILFRNGNVTYLLDGDNIRHGLNCDLGFDEKSRVENIRRIGEVCRLFVDSAHIVLSAFISPFKSDRHIARSLVDYGEFIEIFVNTPLDECERRDPKGLYKKARKQAIKNFTGIDSPYEIPENPEIVVKTENKTVDEAAMQIVRYLLDNNYIKDYELNLPLDLKKYRLTHLQQLEAEAIHIMREVVAEFENPAMLYSIGKDSSVMLHLARKAFYPASPPFPLVHVDTTWKFKEMIDFRDRIARESGMELIVYVNPKGDEIGINPFEHGSAMHTDIMKTQALRQMLDRQRFDAVFGGARRDEEKSRAKERIYSFRDKNHRWDPQNQRPELWNVYNARVNKGESIRVFPLSNWTELDIWQYIYLENIPIVPLYFAAERPVVEYMGTKILVDDDRMPEELRKKAKTELVRFRTLGCYPLTGAINSDAKTLPDIIKEMLLTSTSERQGRLIDGDQNASMEQKKQEGYF